MSAPSHGGLRPNVLAALIFFTGAGARGEPPPVPPPADKPVPHLPARIIEAVSARLPKYVPPAPPKPVASPGMSGVSDTADEILSLPDFKVTAAKLPPLSSFDFLTSKGRLELALKDNAGLRFGPFSKLNGAVALEIQKEEQEVGKRAALTEEVLSVAVLNDAKSKEEIRLMRAATARPNTDWLTKSPGTNK